MALWRGAQRIGGTDDLAPPPPERIRQRRRARRRWVFAAVITFILVNVLAVGAYANSRFAPDHQRTGTQSSASVPAPVRDGGTVVDLRGGKLDARRMPARTIALTFDDGPDPVWTPKVLDVLSRHHAPATFFVLGAQVSRYPDITRRMVREGHELGIHTFTHPELTNLPTWRRRLEYAQTEAVIGYTTGVTTPLARLPYSSAVDAVDDADWAVVRDSGRRGYVSVFEDTDSQDWARPGPDAIVRNATPEGDRGAIVLLHDSGGDRAQTVAALDRFIPEMQARGYRFTTVSQGLGWPAAAPAGTGDRIQGGLLVWAVRTADATTRGLWLLLIVVGLLTLARTLLLFGVRRRTRPPPARVHLVVGPTGSPSR